MAKGAGGFVILEAFPIYPQVIHNLSTWGPLLLTVGVLGYALYLRWLIFKEFPSQRAINKLRAEIDEFSGDLADLTERFSRFQKREGMRTARAEKASAADIQAQAAAILAEKQLSPQTPSDGPMAGKLHLYRQ